jgi:hypothetical protein
MPIAGRNFSLAKGLAVACLASAAILAGAAGASAQTPAAAPACTLQPVEFDGFQAQQLSNAWVQLIFVPQLGGRLMQVTFAGHPYLFVNPEFKGKYVPPPDPPKGKWFNYGGDKIWPMPEGDEDADHWPGPIADALDDGTYTFSPLDSAKGCGVKLDGPADARTGLQYSREISIARDAPEIHFHAVMKNASAHAIRWSMQTVSQYDTADVHDAAAYNKNFWAFTPANPRSEYFTRFQVRDGLANDPSFEVKDDLFRLHWLPLQNEVWLDSTAGWVAVVDRASHFAMIERFEFQAGANYPGKASVIFYKNGPSFGLNAKGLPALHGEPGEDPFYMEAELNCPVVPLAPGETYAMDTTWDATRAGDAFESATATALIDSPLALTMADGHPELSGTFGVFAPGDLSAVFFDASDKRISSESLKTVRPDELVVLKNEVHIPPGASRVEVHLARANGADLGSLGEVSAITAPGASQ